MTDEDDNNTIQTTTNPISDEDNNVIVKDKMFQCLLINNNIKSLTNLKKYYIKVKNVTKVAGITHILLYLEKLLEELLEELNKKELDKIESKINNKETN